MTKNPVVYSVAIASDHAGWTLKKGIVRWLERRGHTVLECGPKQRVANDDYPAYAAAVAKAIREKKADCGILLCGSGEGMSIAANRFAGIRAVDGFTSEQVKISRQHNDANVLSLGARLLKQNNAEKFVQLFLETPFTGAERHVRRIRQIEEAALKN